MKKTKQLALLRLAVHLFGDCDDIGFDSGERLHDFGCAKKPAHDIEFAFLKECFYF